MGSVTPITVEQYGRRSSHYAFQPDPLCPETLLSPKTYSTIESVAMEFGKLEGAPTHRRLLIPSIP
jgi:hypothetical protein